MIKIGIDPDLEKNGYALMVNDKIVALDNLPFFDLCERLRVHNQKSTRLMVVIEGGWLIKKSNWHRAKGLTAEHQAAKSQRIAKNVGENHAAGKLIVAWCERMKIPHEIVKPKGKVDQDHFRKLTGWVGRTNQEQRDAALLIWGRQ